MFTSTWQAKLIIACTIKVAGAKAEVLNYKEAFIFYPVGSVMRLGRKRSHALCLPDDCMSERFQTFLVVDDSIFNWYSLVYKSNWLSIIHLNKMLDRLKVVLQQFSEYYYLKSFK